MESAHGLTVPRRFPWGTVSLVLFACSAVCFVIISSHINLTGLAELLGFGLYKDTQEDMAALMALTAIVLNTIGLVTALIGIRQDRPRGRSIAGTVINGAIVLSAILFGIAEAT